MKKLFVIWILIAGVVGPQVWGQAPTLMLIVKKKENTQTTGRSTSKDYYYGDTYYHRSGVETVCYTVDLINAGADVPQAKVNWSVLLMESRTGELRVVEGIKTTELKRGQKFSMQTDIIELASFSRSTYSNSKSTSAELVGYLVEVIVDGKVAASDAKPMDIRNKITGARKETDKPKRHTF